MTTKNKWKPKEGERYWHVNLDGRFGRFEIDYSQWFASYHIIADRFNYRIGNCFKTKTQAQEALKAIKKLLKELNK